MDEFAQWEWLFQNESRGIRTILIPKLTFNGASTASHQDLSKKDIYSINTVRDYMKSVDTRQWLGATFVALNEPDFDTSHLEFVATGRVVKGGNPTVGMECAQRVYEIVKGRP
jgi:hypothetical protein